MRCGGALKTRVVFFGDKVPAEVTKEAFDRLAEAETLLVLGTSLAVFSGYRFLLRASERRMPIFIVNRGPVRGEERATRKLEGSTGAVLARLAELLA